jgi:glucosamine kinase
MDRTALFLGIDGGGTRCRARLCDPNEGILGEGSAGPANLRFGIEEAFASVLDATRQCFADAGLPIDQLSRTTACVALAGASEPTYLAAGRAYAHPFQRMIVTTDAQAACIGAHGDKDGGIVIIGTGTIGWAQMGGRQLRVGGWGFPVSDEGSGAWLGCEAARRVLWAHDGRIAWTGLLKAIFADFRSDPHEVVRWMTKAAPRDFGRLAHTVADHAAAGDPLARELMQLAAEHVDALAARLMSFGVERLALAGGLANAMIGWLAPETRRALVAPEGDALDGALQIASTAARATALTE